VDEEDGYINLIADYSKKMVDSVVLDTMSPESQKKYKDTLKRKRKDILDKLNN
jgi:hypothetical protein